MMYSVIPWPRWRRGPVSEAGSGCMGRSPERGTRSAGTVIGVCIARRNSTIDRVGGLGASSNAGRKKGRREAGPRMNPKREASGRLLLRLVLRIEELRVLGRTLQRRRGRLALDGRRHRVEIAGADLALVLHRGEAQLRRRELGFLQLDERAHLLARVAVRQVEHAVVQRVEAGERDELELVAHRAELALELRDRLLVEVLLPVERRRAVVGEHLARELLVDRLGEGARELQVGRARLAPDEIGVGRIRQTARDRLLEPVARAVEAFDGALAGEKRP